MFLRVPLTNIPLTLRYILLPSTTQHRIRTHPPVCPTLLTSVRNPLPLLAQTWTLPPLARIVRLVLRPHSIRLWNWPSVGSATPSRSRQTALLRSCIVHPSLFLTLPVPNTPPPRQLRFTTRHRTNLITGTKQSKSSYAYIVRGDSSLKNITTRDKRTPTTMTPPTTKRKITIIAPYTALVT